MPWLICCYQLWQIKSYFHAGSVGSPHRMLMCASCMYVVTLSLIKSTKYACTIFFEAPMGPICSAYSICRLTYGKRLHSRLLNMANKMIHSMRRSKNGKLHYMLFIWIDLKILIVSHIPFDEFFLLIKNQKLYNKLSLNKQCVAFLE